MAEKQDQSNMPNRLSSKRRAVIYDETAIPPIFYELRHFNG